MGTRTKTSKASRFIALRGRICRIARMRNTAHCDAYRLWERMTDAERAECQAMGGPDAELQHLDGWFGDIES
jgi:hypothetical protein